MYFTLALLLTTVFNAPFGQAARTKGCTASSTYGPSSNYTESLTSSGVRRTYFLQTPQNYNPNSEEGQPLIVFFHGHDRTGKIMADLTRLGDPALNPDAVVVFPDGLQNAWQGAPYAAPGVNDMQFTLDILDQLSDELCLDTARFYAAGSSNGGGFTNRLACDAETSKHFAAFLMSSPAVYNGSLPAGGCRPSRSPLPILDVHGLQDAVVPYKGGASPWNGPNGTQGTATVPSVRTFLRQWARRNKCADSQWPKPVSADAAVEQFFEWNGCALQHYTMVKEGHGWMGNKMVNRTDGQPEDEASIMIDFFKGFTLPSMA